jgi:hypothetical protein
MKEMRIVVLLGMFFLAINGAWFHLALTYLVGIYIYENPLWIVNMVDELFNNQENNK